MSLSECGAQNQQGPQPKRQAPLQNLPECEPLCFTAVGFAENNHGTDDTPEQKAAVNQRSALVGVTEPGGTVGSHRHTQNDAETGADQSGTEKRAFVGVLKGHGTDHWKE